MHSWSEAQKEILSIQEKEKQSRMLRQLIRRQVEAHHWDEAEQVIDKIQDSEQQTMPCVS